MRVSLDSNWDCVPEVMPTRHWLLWRSVQGRVPMNNQIVRLWWVGLLLLGALIVLSGCGPGTATPTMPPATPTPPPTPSPGPAVTYHARDFGVTWSSTYYLPFSQQPQQAVDAGATWDRWDFHWEWIMRSDPPAWQEEWPTSYNYDIAVDQDRGTSPPLNILAILNGPLLEDPTYGPGGSWEQFVRAVQKQYGDRISAWELGNETGFVHEEPNNPGNPPLTPGEYAQALATTCAVLGEDSTLILGSPTAQVGLSVANLGHDYFKDCVCVVV